MGRGTPKSVRLKAFCNRIRPTANYGSELWILDADGYARLDAKEFRWIKRCLLLQGTDFHTTSFVDVMNQLLDARKRRRRSSRRSSNSAAPPSRHWAHGIDRLRSTLIHQRQCATLAHYARECQRAL